MVPKISFLPWSLSETKDSLSYGNSIEHLVSIDFQKMSGLVYLGKIKEKSAPEYRLSDIVLGGNLVLNKEGILFTAEITFTKHFKSYDSKTMVISWDDIGLAPSRIVESYLSLIRDKIRLNRFLLLPPRSENVSNEISDELLSSSEYNVYRLVFQDQLSDNEKLAKLNLLRVSKPRASFLKFESNLLNLKINGRSAIKEVWKEWSENKYSNSPFTFLLSYEIAKLHLTAKDFESAAEFFQITRKERENQSRVYHLDYANSLSRLGQILVSNGKMEEALYYFTSAKEMFETLSFSNTYEYHLNQIHYSLLLAMLGQKEIALNEFFELEKNIHLFSEFNQALFYYNFARLEYALSVYDSSLYFASLAKEKLFQIGQTNHELNFHLILLMGASHFHLKNFNLAQNMWEEIQNAKSMIPIEDQLFFRNSLFNLAYLNQQKGAVSDSETLYKQYTRLSPYSSIISLDPKSNLLVMDYVQIDFFIEPNLEELNSFEETVIRSYTGRYIFTGQDEEIRARTYQDRLEDTNEFLRDLLSSDFFGSPALGYLKESLFPPGKSYAKGENVVFIDIGPALNNLEAPGITSQSVAYHFPKMSVILWELPTEVELFQKKVPNDKKEALYSFDNIRILAADGVGNFLESYLDANRWFFRNRNIPKLENKTIILRAANSIDIYETYAKIQPHLKDVGSALKTNPVLYFFNRSILFKPAGKTKFTLIGYQSVRGFHHNFQSLDRNGEPPYTLAKYTLSEY